MVQDRIKYEYFIWMYDFTSIDIRGSYWCVMNRLNSIDFRSDIPLDMNRAEDGTDLRYRFGDDYGYSQVTIANGLDMDPCSVLEMMVALANRCEESIMSNPEIGDRTGVWFFEMIESLGLDKYDDAHYDDNAVSTIINDFLEHRYEKNGRGGLFTIHNPNHDMPNTEIWSQMWFYLSEH